MLDYSQFGQGLILEQLLTPGMPRFLVDVGAYDGLTGSNSRALLEQNWQAVLVEPIPNLFSKLQANSSSLRGVSLVNAACSDRTGTANIRLGKDGTDTQMSSLSTHPLVEETLGKEAVAVKTLTLRDLFSSERVPDDFGVLLIDAEGWDFAVLSGLANTSARPRIIVTEDFAGTDEAKYDLLRREQYRFIGRWGCDSFWVAKWHSVDTAHIRLPIERIPEDWLPTGKRVGGLAKVDGVEYGCLYGWACIMESSNPAPEVIVSLKSENSPQRYLFRAFRSARPDVAAHFSSSTLLSSGYRTPLDLPSGKYEVTIIQHREEHYSEEIGGVISSP
ncbi:MAG: FkbM family methyltransferase [Acidobacteriota bacterium]|nr:FkbM family methyltransferase [Acidobacteriota bacterium]